VSFDFASPFMLWGAALVSVPILIHLLNRRRFVRQRFAAMRFLEAAFRKRRKRLRLENLLLLLLRCLAVAVAALAMAQPFVPSDSVLAVVSQGRREVVLVLDRSGSMGRLVASGMTLDDRMLDDARRRLGRLSDERGDAVTLVTLGAGLALPAPIGASPTMALAALERALPDPAGVADLVALARLLEQRVFAERTGRVDLEIYTDLQDLTWREQGPAFARIVGPLLEEGGGTLRLVDVGADLPPPRNLSVTGLAAEDRVLLAGETLAFTATVGNPSPQARSGVSGSFLLDGKKVRDVTLDVPPSGAASTTLPLRVDVPGPHHVAFALEPDELPFDDVRTLAFAARESLRIVLVDGSPGDASPLTWASGFLQLALEPGLVDGATRFHTTVHEVQEFEERLVAGMPEVDLVVLANVGELGEEAAAALADAVRGGTPLLAWLGDQLVPHVWNERLASRGLLPGRIGRSVGDPSGTAGEDYVTLSLPDPPTRALELFADDRLGVLLQVPVLAWWELQPHEDARVHASFVDALGKSMPAIVESTLERGRVLAVATSPDDTWTLWPRNPGLWVPLVHELVAELTADDPGQLNVPVGHSPTLAIRGRPRSATLQAPSGAMTAIEQPDAVAIGARSLLSLSSTPLFEAGAWRLDVESSGVQAEPITESFALAAVPDAREGDLTRVDPGALDAALGGLPYTLGEATAEDDDAGRPDGDGGLARALLWTLLAVVLGESVLARAMGRHR